MGHSVKTNLDFFLLSKNLLTNPTWNKQNEDFGVDIFKKGQILRHFSDLAPSKLKFCEDKILMVTYVQLQYSTYQFSGESCTKKKVGPKRVKLQNLSNHNDCTLSYHKICQNQPTYLYPKFESVFVKGFFTHPPYQL